MNGYPSTNESEARNACAPGGTSAAPNSGRIGYSGSVGGHTTPPPTLNHALERVPTHRRRLDDLETRLRGEASNLHAAADNVRTLRNALPYILPYGAEIAFEGLIDMTLMTLGLDDDISDLFFAR